MTKNVDIDKHKYSGYGIAFDRLGIIPHPSGGTGKNVINMSSSTKIENNKKYVFVKAPTQGLEHTLSAEKMYSTNFTENNKKFCFELAL